MWYENLFECIIRCSSFEYSSLKIESSYLLGKFTPLIPPFLQNIMWKQSSNFISLNIIVFHAWLSILQGIFSYCENILLLNKEIRSALRFNRSSIKCLHSNTTRSPTNFIIEHQVCAFLMILLLGHSWTNDEFKAAPKLKSEVQSDVGKGALLSQPEWYTNRCE